MFDKSLDQGNVDYAACQIRVQLSDAVSLLAHIASDTLAQIHHLEAHITELTRNRRGVIDGVAASLLPDISVRSEARLQQEVPGFLDDATRKVIDKHKKLMGLLALPGHDEALLGLQAKLAKHLAHTGACGVGEYDQMLAEQQFALKAAIRRREQVAETMGLLEHLNKHSAHMPRHIEGKLQQLLHTYHMQRTPAGAGQAHHQQGPDGLNLSEFRARLGEVLLELTRQPGGLPG